MEKQTFNKTKFKPFLLLGIVLVVVFNVLFGLFLQNRSQQREQAPKQEQIVAPKNTFSYKGENGKDALLILKEKASIKQDKSGLVVEINGRKTDIKKEFWAFFVNGEFADIGPADYQTKDTDLIEWKVEKIK